MNAPPDDREQPSGFPANAGSHLAQLYAEHKTFVQKGRQGDFGSTLAQLIMIEGEIVGVDVRTRIDVETMATTLVHYGMRVSASDPKTHTVAGFLPIENIPAVATLPETISILPIFRPVRRIR